MAGDLWQWCWDWYGDPYAGGTDPHGPQTGVFCVMRGGSWSNY
ncbi:MAG: SUMF1/EgtB/PvdO family nonheme iron enzyme [Verrucomicrobiota bacterium]